MKTALMMLAAKPAAVGAGHHPLRRISGISEMDVSGFHTKPMAARCGSLLKNT